MERRKRKPRTGAGGHGTVCLHRLASILVDPRPSHHAGLRFSAAVVCLVYSLANGSPAGPITVQEVTDCGQPSYQISTPTATWVYDREGAGFSRLLDPAGNDWIAYKPTGGAAGHYRGIPNAVFRADTPDRNFFHPGHTGPKASTTKLLVATTEQVVLRSLSGDGRWTAEWTIRRDRAQLRLSPPHGADPGYWFLYEGTPGGQFDPADLCLRADGALAPLGTAWEASMQDVPWVAFVSRVRRHAVILIVHEPPDTRVSYRPMENAMTVFGFGREHGSLTALLTRPLTFTVALVAATEPERIATLAAELCATASDPLHSAERSRNPRREDPPSRVLPAHHANSRAQ